MAEHAEVIGDYVVLNTLGSGAVGTAYQARHMRAGHLVALKLMHDRLASDEDVQKRFVREVSVLEKLDHPNIVRHLDCGLDDGRIYFAMEWVDYGSLDDVLKRRQRLPWREVVECAIQICKGLSHAHERGIIHRDLKPANLFLSSDGDVKIGDFGLARDANLHRLTDDGNTVGTCRYMAPEQIRGADHLTGGVDLYALGCLIFRMITGRVPFDGQTVIEIFESHLYDKYPGKVLERFACPPELVELIGQLLTKDPIERPAEASELAEALEAILAGQEVDTDFTTGKAAEPKRATDDQEDTPAPAPPNLTERLVADDDQGFGQGRMGTWLIAIGLLMMVLVILLVGYFRK